MEDEVLILFTMDVELPSSGAVVSGPSNNEEGVLRIKEYMDAIGEYGYTPTFFIHLELGKEQADLFLDLKKAGRMSWTPYSIAS
jgi:hypothetical protein